MYGVISLRQLLLAVGVRVRTVAGGGTATWTTQPCDPEKGILHKSPQAGSFESIDRCISTPHKKAYAVVITTSTASRVPTYR